MAKKKDLDLEKRLVLHTWMNDLFGYESTRKLLDDVEGAYKGFDAKGVSGVLQHLGSRRDNVKIPQKVLKQYDTNIRDHLDAINHQRAEPITLLYFQHLAALYTEVFLDRRFSEPDELAADLNRFAEEREKPVAFEKKRPGQAGVLDGDR